MDKNEIAWRSNKQEFAEEFSERGVLGESVAEDVVGKIYCPCREDPLSLLDDGFIGMIKAGISHLSGK